MRMLGKPTNSEQSTNTGYKLTCALCQLVDKIRDIHKIYMIISTEEVFIAPWLVKEQGAREQWIYLTSTQFSYLKMLAPKFTVITSLIDIDIWKCMYIIWRRKFLHLPTGQIDSKKGHPLLSGTHTLLLYTFLLRSKVPRSNEDSLCIDYH